MPRTSTFRDGDGDWKYYWLNDSYMLADPEPGVKFPMSSTWGSSASINSGSWEVGHLGSYWAAILHSTGFSFGDESNTTMQTGDSHAVWFTNAGYASNNGMGIGGVHTLDLSAFPYYTKPAALIVPNFDATAYLSHLGATADNPYITYTSNSPSLTGIGGSGYYTSVPTQPITCQFIDTITEAVQTCIGAMGMIHFGMIHDTMPSTPIYIDFIDSLGAVIETAELGYYDGTHPADTTSQCEGRFTSQYVHPDSDLRLAADGDYGTYGGTQIFWYEKRRCAGFIVRKEWAYWPDDHNPSSFYLGAFGKKVIAKEPPLRWTQRDDGNNLWGSNERFGQIANQSPGTTAWPIGQNRYE